MYILLLILALALTGIGFAHADSPLFNPGVVGPGASTTDNAVARWDGTSGVALQDSSGVTIDDSDTLSIETLNTPMLQTRHSDTASSGSGIAIRRSRGTTIGGNTIVQDNDILGNLNFMGADGTNFEGAAIVRGEIDGTPSDGTDMPGALVFLTTPEASATATERIRIDSAGRMSSITNTGTAGAGVSILELGDGFHHITRIDMGTGVLANIPGADAEGVGLLIYTFPAGVIIVDAVHMDVGITQSQGNINNDTPIVGIGSVIAVGDVSDLNGTSTFEDYVTGVAAANCTGTVTDSTTEMTAGGSVIIPASGGLAHTVHFNAADTWAGADSAATLSGQVWIAWRFLGA